MGQSQKYIDIDQTDLYTSIAWFKRQQNEFGCFPKVGYTHSYYLKGGWGKSNDEEGTLTAFVLIAMLEAGLPKNVSFQAYTCFLRMNILKSLLAHMIKICPLSGDVAGVVNFSHLQLFLQNHLANSKQTFKHFWLKDGNSYELKC